MIDFSDFKTRCSSVNKVMANSRSNPSLTEVHEKRIIELETREKGMTEPMKLEYAKLLQYRENSKKVILSDTCIDYLLEVYAWRVYRKKAVVKELDIMYTAKGKEIEVDSIILLSKVDGVLYFKNKEQVSNDFLTGEPDIIADRIIDAKSAWDYPGFLKKVNSPIDPAHDLQIKGYIDITGLPSGEVAHCLVSSSEGQIFEFLQRIKRQMGILWDEDPVWLQKAAEIENSMRFDDIPMNQRVYKIPVEPFTKEYRQKLYDRVKICRDWLNNFHESYQNLNKICPETEIMPLLETPAQ